MSSPQKIIVLLYVKELSILLSCEDPAGFDFDGFDYGHFKNSIQEVTGDRDYYKLEKSFTETEKNKIINDIQNDTRNEIYLVTNDKGLFVNFNRKIKLGCLNKQGFELENFEIEPNLVNILNYIRMHNIHDLSIDLNKMFCIREYFNIDIEKLINETNYNATKIKELRNLINEDVRLLNFKNILTSRLAIVLYRLYFFDLDTKATSIGYFFKEHLGVKSESFKFVNLHNNLGLYFSNLVNKSFRGYKIPLATNKIPDSLFVEKIKIAKNLLKLKVKMKIVSEALDIDEDELNKIIYEDNNAYFNKQHESPFKGLNIPTVSPIEKTL